MRHVVHVFGAGAAAADIAELLVLGADRVHLVDVPADADAEHQVLRIALGTAREVGCPSTFEMNSRSELVNR